MGPKIPLYLKRRKSVSVLFFFGFNNCFFNHEMETASEKDVLSPLVKKLGVGIETYTSERALPLRQGRLGAE